MSAEIRRCPDCDGPADGVSRREFLKTAGAATLALGGSSLSPVGSLVSRAAAPAGAARSAPETLVKTLYDSFNDRQRKELCFDWDYVDPKRGLLRTRVENNWHITRPVINSDFFTNDQRALIRGIFEGILQPDWHERIDRQLKDDAGGFGNQQNVAIFGKPGDGKFEFVMTGRHMTMRCDGNSAEHVAFGGPIFYGHAASGFNEKPDHPGNVFWHQALAANKLYSMLDGKQQKLAMVENLPDEREVAFQGSSGQFPGIPVTELSGDQKEHLQEVLRLLIEPYRQIDRDEVQACLKAQGGLDKCALGFYRDEDLGNDKIWDCWRLEGPAFVWYFRGAPHVHVWVNVADNPTVKTNT